jgi:adenosylmethionine-8-amino-7-oxononanoate aminotransferase
LTASNEHPETLTFTNWGFTVQNLPNLDHYWLPFTANRQFKSMPRLFKAAKGNYYTSLDDHTLLDATAGLWCVAAGHCREEIASAVAHQLRTLDYAPAFQSCGTPGAIHAQRAGPDFLHRLRF